MTGTVEPFKYKAMAAQIVSAEGMGNLLPVVEKELLHYRILDAMMREGFFSSLVFQGGTSLRLCHGSPRYSEDLDFAGGTSFVRSSSMWKAPPRFLPTSCSPMPAHRTCGDATCGTCAGWRREATSIPDGRWSLRN